MDLLNEINKAQAGSKNLKITFKQTAIGDIQYLVAMHQSGIIMINDNDLMILNVVKRDGITAMPSMAACYFLLYFLGLLLDILFYILFGESWTDCPDKIASNPKLAAPIYAF